MKIDPHNPFTIVDNIYCIMIYSPKFEFYCNTYVIIDEDEVILIEPGSITHFAETASKIISIYNLKKTNYIILTHQDPDIASSVPVFENIIQNPNLKIVTNEWTSYFIDFYGIKSKYIIVENLNWELTLKSGRKLKFIKTKFMHNPIGFVIYDEKTKILFSGDVFSTFTKDRNYTNTNLKNNEIVIYEAPQNVATKLVQTLKQLEIEYIAPQHGFILTKKEIPLAYEKLLNIPPPKI